MQVSNNNNKYTPHFQAIPVAKVKTPQAEITLLQLDKKADNTILENLQSLFLPDNILDRFPNTLKSAMREFMKNALASVSKDGVKGVLSAKDGVPTGLVTYKVDKSENAIYIDYLASWVPESAKKIKNNGKMLVDHVYQEAIHSGISSITLTPGFNSLMFYKKLGFKPSSSTISIDAKEIKEQVQKLKKTFLYEKINYGKSIDLKF